MVSKRSLKRTLLGRDVAVAYAVVMALYLVRYVEVQPLQIPAYLLIVAYDVLELALPVLTPYYPVGFPLFLYVVAVAAASASRWLRAGENGSPGWIRTVGGVSLVVGTLSLLFGAFVGGPVVSPVDNPTPLAITGAVGIVLLLGGWWLLGRPSPGARVAA
jgi:hypothetical protein